MDELTQHVEDLIAKSSEAKEPISALQYSQAALNAANAIATLQTVGRAKKSDKPPISPAQVPIHP